MAASYLLRLHCIRCCVGANVACEKFSNRSCGNSLQSLLPNRPSTLSNLGCINQPNLPLRSTSMKDPSDMVVSPLKRQATEALRSARKLPVGPDRNDLRQLAVGLRFLDKQRLKSKVQDRSMASDEIKEAPRTPTRS